MMPSPVCCVFVAQFFRLQAGLMERHHHAAVSAVREWAVIPLSPAVPSRTLRCDSLHAWPGMRKDIIDEFIGFAVTLCGISTGDALRLEIELRSIYGGVDDSYIRKTMSNARDAQMLAVREAQRTGRVREAALKHGISRTTLYRLLSQARKLRAQEPRA